MKLFLNGDAAAGNELEDKTREEHDAFLKISEK